MTAAKRKRTKRKLSRVQDTALACCCQAGATSSTEPRQTGVAAFLSPLDLKSDHGKTQTTSDPAPTKYFQTMCKATRT
eukprot:3987795-Amphidinium_carterae.1